MNFLLEQIEQHIVLGGVTEAIGIDTLLEKPDDTVAIYEYQGINSIPQYGLSLRSVQIVVRSKTVAKASSLIDTIYKMFKSEDGVFTIGNLPACLVNLRQRPFKFKVDDKGRVLYCFNLGITTQDN